MRILLTYPYGLSACLMLHGCAVAAHPPRHIHTPPTLVRDPSIPRSPEDDLIQPLTPELSSDPWRQGQGISLLESLVAEFKHPH